MASCSQRPRRSLREWSLLLSALRRVGIALGACAGLPMRLAGHLSQCSPTEGSGRRSASQAAGHGVGASRGWFSVSLSLPQQRDWFQEPEALKARVPWLLEPSLRIRPHRDLLAGASKHEGIFLRESLRDSPPSSCS